MKQFIAFFLIFFLFWQLAYKTSYVVYWKINQDIIAAKYCENKAKPILQCNGKCHLAKQLQKVDDTKTEESTILDAVLKLKSLDCLVFQFCSFNLRFIPFKDYDNSFLIKHLLHYSSGYLSKLYRPPEFI